jgi:pimeloyl-ACP methyl ester carboxylesterase
VTSVDPTAIQVSPADGFAIEPVWKAAMSPNPQPPAPARQASVLTRLIQLRIGRVMLSADLGLPSRPHGIVLFAHDDGADRFVPIDNAVANEVRRGGIATLAADLVTRADPTGVSPDSSLRRLTERLCGIIDWCWREPQLRGLPIGLYGVGMGGSAALRAAVERPENVRALVLRAARCDALPPAVASAVSAATLLIVSGNDQQTLDANADMIEHVRGPRDLYIVDAASPRFAESAAAEETSQKTRQWFLRHLPRLK